MQDRFITKQFISEAFVKDAVLLHTMFLTDALENEAVPMQDRFFMEQFVSEALVHRQVHYGTVGQQCVSERCCALAQDVCEGCIGKQGCTHARDSLLNS